MNAPLAIAVAGAAISMIAHSGDAYGQTSALQQRLETATRVECSFTALATGTWEDDVPTATVQPTEAEAVFFDVNVAEGSAEFDGAFGATFIVVRYANGYLHFMQMSDAGPLHLTTVLAQESKDGRLKAVQTRHEYSPTILPGFTSRPEMYIGDCAVSS